MRALAVRFEQLTRWDVKSFLLPTWNWDESEILPLGSVLHRRVELYKGAEAPTLLSIHFDGELSKRGAKTIKGALFVAQPGDLVYSKIDVRNGAIGLVPDEFGPVTFTAEFPVYQVDKALIDPHYLKLILKTTLFNVLINATVSGSSGRKRVNPDSLEALRIPVPSLSKQRTLVEKFQKARSMARQHEQRAYGLEAELNELVKESLGLTASVARTSFISVVRFRELTQWGVKRASMGGELSSKFPSTTLRSQSQSVAMLIRGKSPRYANSSELVLNQKCNRWDSIDLQHAKSVSPSWLASVDPNLFTKQDDILVNSTGEGTIGRASLIRQEIGYFYDSHLLMLRFNMDGVIVPAFFVTLLNSPVMQNQIAIIKSAQSTKQTELGLNNLLDLSFPLPPKPLQQSIVERVATTKQQLEVLKEKAQEKYEEANATFESLLVGEGKLS